MATIAKLKFQTLMCQLCGWSAVVLVFSAPLSRALFGISGLLFVIGWFGQCNFRERLIQIKSFPVTPPAASLIVIILLWSIWSSAPIGDVFNTFKVYSKIILLLMLASTFSVIEWQQRGWWGFMAGMTLVLVSTFANVVIDLPWSKTQNQGLGVDHSVFVEYVSQSVMTAIFLAFTIQRTLDAKSKVRMCIWGTI